MHAPEDLEFREQQRLSKALQGKLGSQAGANSRKSWAPVVTKPTPTTPVNSQFASISLSDSQHQQSSSGVDTTSIYPGAIVEEKVKQQEANRLKRMGLSNDDEESNIPAYQSLNSSSSSISKSSSNTNLAKETSSSNLLQYQSPQPINKAVSNSPSSDNLVDSASIMNNVDSHTSEEKMKQEAKRLERWGLKINTPSSPSPSTTSPPIQSTTPSYVPTTPESTAIPQSPFTTSAAVSVNQTSSTLPIATTQQFLDRVILSAKSVKQIIQKKTSNRDIVIAILMDLVKESANFGMNLQSTSPMSFDISQNAGKLAGAVNELVKDTAHENDRIFDEIQVLLGLLYLAVVAN